MIYRKTNEDNYAEIIIVRTWDCPMVGLYWFHLIGMMAF